MSLPKATRFDISPPNHGRTSKKSSSSCSSTPKTSTQKKPKIRTSTPERPQIRRSRVRNETFSMDEDDDLYKTGLSEFFANLDDSIENPSEHYQLKVLVEETPKKLKQLYQATSLKILAESKKKIEECLEEMSRANMRAFNEMERQSAKVLDTMERKFEMASQRTEHMAVIAMAQQIAESKEFTRFLEREYQKMLDQSQQKINSQVRIIDSLTDRLNFMELDRNMKGTRLNNILHSPPRGM